MPEARSRPSLSFPSPGEALCLPSQPVLILWYYRVH